MSYEPSSRIVSTICSGSEPDPYTMPFHVPATDLTSDTATGATGPALAHPISEAANPTMTIAVRRVHSDRAPLVVIASLLLSEPLDHAARSRQQPSRALALATMIF